MGALLLASTFQSCLDDDNDSISIRYPNALVTVKTSTDNAFYLQLDDKTTLLPTNLKKSPFGEKEVRALLNFTETNEESKGYSKAVYVNWIDSILTKPAVPTLSTTEENDAKYGTDPIEIVKDWVTIAEDGYLTLRFSTLWGGQKTHFINLLTGVNPENPYEVELRHNANGDIADRRGEALVAFNLKDLPDTEGKTVKLKINWQSFSGKKSAEFNFCSRATTETANMLHGETEFVTSLE